MIREEEARGHRGGRGLGMAASLNRLVPLAIIGGILCGTMPDGVVRDGLAQTGLAQDGHSHAPSPSNEAMAKPSAPSGGDLLSGHKTFRPTIIPLRPAPWRRLSRASG